MPNQGGKLIFLMRQKLAKMKTMKINRLAILESNALFLLSGTVISTILIKKLLFTHVKKVDLEVFIFEKLNFSKTAGIF